MWGVHGGGKWTVREGVVQALSDLHVGDDVGHDGVPPFGVGAQGCLHVCGGHLTHVHDCRVHVGKPDAVGAGEQSRSASNISTLPGRSSARSSRCWCLPASDRSRTVAWTVNPRSINSRTIHDAMYPVDPVTAIG